MILETSESRPAFWVGVKLLALSLESEAPGTLLRIWNVPPASALAEWCKDRPNVTLASLGDGFPTGWDVKASVLLEALERGGESEAWWIDADIVLASDPRPLLLNLRGGSAGALVATEEPRLTEQPQGSDARVGALGLRPGRSLPRTVNSSVLGVTHAHRPLLQAWRELMAAVPFQEAQQRPFSDRPTGLAGDQDVLTGLLASENFAEVPVRLLRSGVDIAHCMHATGFGSRHRVRALTRGLPPLVHAQGEKPWVPGHIALSTRVSPYAAVAHRYRSGLGEPAPWTHPTDPPALFLHHLFLGHPTLRGLPLSLARELQAWVQRTFRPG